MVWAFEKRYSDHSVDEFRRVLRRAECLFALIAIRHARVVDDGDDGLHGRVLEESVARTPRFRVDGYRWIALHRAALETFAQVALTPDEHGRVGCQVKPGDLVVLHAGEEPRVRFVIDVGAGSAGSTVMMLDAKDGVRAFLSSHVVTLAWDVGASADALAS